MSALQPKEFLRNYAYITLHSPIRKSVNIFANAMPLILESKIQDGQIFLTTSRLHTQTMEKLVHLIRHLILSLQSIKLKKGDTYYGWIDWICSTLRPFSFVTDDINRQYSKLEKTSYPTLIKYMKVLTKRVEQKLNNLLPYTIVLVIDGWSKNSTHFVVVFASFKSRNEHGYQMILLAFSPMIGEMRFGAPEYFEFTQWVLNLYGKLLRNVVAII